LDGTAEVIVLPMSRYDIADYLALSVGTVSRALTDLRQRRVIALAGTHEVTIVDRGALDTVNGDAADERHARGSATYLRRLRYARAFRVELGSDLADDACRLLLRKAAEEQGLVGKRQAGRQVFRKDGGRAGVGEFC
jgi:Crp-like helix-turn-helix domain